MAAVEVKVTLRGPLFTKKIDKVVQDAIIEHTFKRIDERVTRVLKSKRKGTLGRRKNPIPAGKLNRHLPSFGAGGNASLTFKSTTIWPRTTGRSWQDKNVAIIKSMAPRVMRKTAKKIAAELS